MPTLITTFKNSGKVEFDSGCFDNYCVFVTNPGGERFAPTDLQYFTRIKKLAEFYGAQKIYDDFVVFYNRTSQHIDKKVLKLISMLSTFYENHTLETELWFTVLYAGMIAEENKQNAILKKRVKRLGMYQLLIQDKLPEEAAVFSKGKKWRELDKLMQSYGF